jgi:hypothetical protein
VSDKATKKRFFESIPLLLVSESILDKYAFHPYLIAAKGILPVLTNQLQEGNLFLSTKEDD